MSEAELIELYQTTHSVEVLDEIIRGRSAWIRGVVNRTNLKSWVDRDACFADALSESALSVKNFDRSRNFSSFLARVIRRACIAQQAKQNVSQTSDFDFDRHPDPQVGEAADVLNEIYGIIDSIPPEEINDSTQLVIRRVLSGHSVDEIARMMDWTITRARSAVEHVRCFIAYKMKEKGLSASPWICDGELNEMAAKYEETTRCSWGDHP